MRSDVDGSACENLGEEDDARNSQTGRDRRYSPSNGFRQDEILSPAALAFLADLHRQFNATRKRLLKLREERQKRFDAGETARLPARDQGTSATATGRVAPIPADLQDRRVEITGPVDRKMIINALNSGAKVFMADFEDATSPDLGQHDRGPDQPARTAGSGKIDFTDADHGKAYALYDKPAVLLVRPRGWHLPEEHVAVDGEPMSGVAVRFRPLRLPQRQGASSAKGIGPYFYLPKMESHLEARLWNDVFTHAEDALGLPKRHDQGDGPDRDAAGRLRDGRDPLRAARPHRRASTAAAGTTSSPSSSGWASNPELPHARPLGHGAWARPSSPPIRCC